MMSSFKGRSQSNVVTQAAVEAKNSLQPTQPDVRSSSNQETTALVNYTSEHEESRKHGATELPGRLHRYDIAVNRYEYMLEPAHNLHNAVQDGSLASSNMPKSGRPSQITRTVTEHSLTAC
jgi:hypothetical protein